MEVRRWFVCRGVVSSLVAVARRIAKLNQPHDECRYVDVESHCIDTDILPTSARRLDRSYKARPSPVGDLSISSVTTVPETEDEEYMKRSVKPAPITALEVIAQ